MDGNSFAEFMRPIDRGNMLQFQDWMGRNASSEDRIAVFEKITSGDEWAALSLGALCDMELLSALRHVRGHEEEETNGWFNPNHIGDYLRSCCETPDQHVTMVLGSLVNLAAGGIVLSHTTPIVLDNRLVATGVWFKVHWPKVLEYWSAALESLFKPDGFVYVLGGSSYFKIGRAKDVDNRIKQLAIQLPWQVELETAFPCEDYAKAELALHSRFADKRENGEWFNLDSEDLAVLHDIKRMRGERIEWRSA